MPLSEVFNMDCMEGMKHYPDKYFELAIVDPEYLDKNQPTQSMRKKGLMNNWKGRPKKEFFTELKRVSKDQIIWGGNYFTGFLEENNNWIVWYKNNDGVCFSMAELAWSSIKKPIKVYELRPMGLTAEFHPTSKPIALYKWLLKNYAICPQCKNEKKVIDDDFTKETIPCEYCNGHFKILDTHLGSGSSRIAAHDMGFDFTGYELDKDYFEASVKRFEQYKRQLKLF